MKSLKRYLGFIIEAENDRPAGSQWLNAMFVGTLSRGSYWIAQVMLIVVAILWTFLLGGSLMAAIGLGGDNGGGLAVGLGGFGMLLSALFYLVVAMASLGGELRRLRSAGYTPLLWLLNFVPFVGPLIVFILLLMPNRELYSGLRSNGTLNTELN